MQEWKYNLRSIMNETMPSRAKYTTEKPTVGTVPAKHAGVTTAMA